MILPRHRRYDYSAITDRPDFCWPGGKRLAVYLGVNLEHFAFGEGLGAELAPGGPQPDVLNFAWRDYGNRVGAWRLLEMLDALQLPATVLANSAMYDHAPQLMAAHSTRGDEIAGHGRTNSERQGDLGEAAERHLIAEATARLTDEEGKPPKGWLSPWISESTVTPDLLVKAGYGYTLNWCMDDQPVWLRTRAGPLLSIPYPQELNDIPAIVARKEDAATFAAMIMDTFDEMLDQSKAQSLVMGIALHPYSVGRRSVCAICAARCGISAGPGAISGSPRRVKFTDTSWICDSGQMDRSVDRLNACSLAGQSARGRGRIDRNHPSCDTAEAMSETIRNTCSGLW